MSENFMHGVSVVEIDDGPRIIRTAKSSVIGLIGTATEADSELFPFNQPKLVIGSRKDIQALGIKVHYL